MKLRSLISRVLGIALVLSAFSAAPALAAGLPDSCARDANGNYSKEFEVPCKALDDFLVTFNSRDALAWAKSLNYPHVRLSGGQVHVWDTPEAYAADQDLNKLAAAIGWNGTVWDYRYVVQAGDDGKTGKKKYHVALSFTRLDKNGKPIPGHTFDSFYIITDVNGHWGTQFRSSMAGSTHGKSAY